MKDAAAPSKPSRLRGRPTLEDSSEIEGKLLSVALKEFIRNGYGATSMSKIVAAAKVSKTTLYSRFPSKEAIFRAMIFRAIYRLGLTQPFGFDQGPPDLVRGLEHYANEIIAYGLQSEWLDLNRLMHSEAIRFPELARIIEEASEVGIDQIMDFILKCADADGKPCKSPRTVAASFMYMQRGWYMEKMLSHQKITKAMIEEWAHGTVRTLVNGRNDW